MTFDSLNSILFWNCSDMIQKPYMMSNNMIYACLENRKAYSPDSPFMLASFPDDECVKKVVTILMLIIRFALEPF